MCHVLKGQMSGPLVLIGVVVLFIRYDYVAFQRREKIIYFILLRVGQLIWSEHS